jgi:hypothetical protein
MPLGIEKSKIMLFKSPMTMDTTIVFLSTFHPLIKDEH